LNRNRLEEYAASYVDEFNWQPRRPRLDRHKVTSACATLFIMTDLGKVLVVFGALILLVGVGLLIAGRMNLPLGRLPGDIIYRSKHTTFYFPLVTSIILSVVLSVVLYLVSRFSAK
jgi:ABC-type anion transport system duplicated permease subunit